MTRPVKVFERRTPTLDNPNKRVVVGRGNFHQFGISHVEYDNGPGEYSTALVEMHDGTMRNVDVELIEFLDVYVED